MVNRNKKIITFILVALCILSSALANPKFTIKEKTDFLNFYANENEAFSYQFDTTAADSGTKIYTITPQTGTISPSGLYTITPTASQVGQNQVTVKVNDQNSQDTLITYLNVNPENDYIRHPPVITFGDFNQEKGETLTQQFSLTNKGTTNVTNISLTLVINEIGFTFSDFNPAITGAPTRLNAGETRTMNLSIYLPLDQYSDDSEIGYLLLTSDQTQIQIPVRTIVDNDLHISQVRINNAIITDEDNLSAKKGDTINLTLQISADSTITTIQTNMYSSTSTISQQLPSITQINAGSTQTIQTAFTIPTTITSGEHSFTLLTQGTDELGSVNYDLFTFWLNIQDQTITTGVTLPTGVNLGGSGQEREEITQTTFTITNTGTQTINNIGLAFSKTISRYTTQQLNITLTGTPSSLSVGQSATITVSSFVPVDFDAGQIKIGDLVFSSSVQNANIPLNLEAENLLRISDASITVDGNDENLDDGDRIDAKRNDDVEITLTVENRFSDSSNIEINDVFVNADSNSLDIDEDSAETDISEDSEEDLIVSFRIPNDADDGTHSVTLRVEGEDENGALHYATMDFRFDVDVKTKEVTLNSVEFSPATICKDQTSATLKIDIENTGTNDLTNAQIYVEGDNFVYSKKISDIELDEGDEKTYTLNIQLPANMAKGYYSFDVKAYYSTGSDTETDEALPTFEIRDCQTTITPTQNTTQGQTGIVLQPYEPGAGAVYGTQAGTRYFAFSKETLYITLLIIANILVLILIIVLVAKRR